MNGNLSNIRTATISDIHLGHRRNSTKDIIANLKLAFPDSPETAELDIIFIAGDVFDDLLTGNDEDLLEAYSWASYMLRLCKRHNIKLRVLEGTPSHDWKQSRIFSVANNDKINCDFKYFEEIDIEYIEDFGIYVLYVPDEKGDTGAEVYEKVMAVMKARGIDKVHVAVMHGCFDYQLPPNVKSLKHEAALYLAIVLYVIWIGHHHTHTRYDRITAQGSFDRLKHDQEEPKGHVRTILYPDGSFKLSFIENQRAKRFVTVNCLGLDLQQTLEKVSRVASELPPDSYLRINTEKSNHIFTNMNILIARFPFINWGKLLPTEERSPLQGLNQVAPYVPVSITKENITGLLMARILNKNTDQGLLAIVANIINEAIS